MYTCVSHKGKVKLPLWGGSGLCPTSLRQSILIGPPESIPTDYVHLVACLSRGDIRLNDASRLVCPAVALDTAKVWVGGEKHLLILTWTKMALPIMAKFVYYVCCMFVKRLTMISASTNLPCQDLQEQQRQQRQQRPQ